MSVYSCMSVSMYWVCCVVCVPTAVWSVCGLLYCHVLLGLDVCVLCVQRRYCGQCGVVFSPFLSFGVVCCVLCVGCVQSIVVNLYGVICFVCADGMGQMGEFCVGSW